ncbi:glutathione S-transferase N-terminal domain-containing protein [Hyphomicrobiales bacterium]|nr:glutathione S-transferase N-terminal domain-containing protein [Hyphomicrobiales bacterium]
MISSFSDMPVLYSFRRCPFAMRARLAVYYSKNECVIREILLSNKPTELVEISPKATVPVMLLSNGLVIEESLEIMEWCFKKNDPYNFMPIYTQHKSDIKKIINLIDGPFKYYSDRYKYSSRYVNEDKIKNRNKACDVLSEIENKINDSHFIFNNKSSYLDLAILPLIRQYMLVDRDWFLTSMPHKKIKNWLNNFLESNALGVVMMKFPVWKRGDKEQVFPLL